MNALELENEALKREARQLREMLAQMNQEGVIVVRKTVAPKDYEANKKRLRELEDAVENLKFILSYSGVSHLESMCEELQNDLRLKVKRIAGEFRSFPVGLAERNQIAHAIQDLRKHAQALESLLK